MEKQFGERLARIETKLDLVLPHIADISELKKDIGLIKTVSKWVVGFVGFFLTLGVSYLSKHKS